jgi:hypothetical protein
VTLRDLVKQPPEEGATVRCPFPAALSGELVTVTAVLDRTAVYERTGVRPPDRELARLELFEPVGELAWDLMPVRGARASAYRGRQASWRSRGVHSGGKKR